jgi:cell division protein FtsW (lipid II flippase)
MKNEYAVGNFRIRFETQARRRWFVALFYVAVAVICLAWCSFNPKETSGAWILSWCMILGTALVIVFTSIAGDRRARGDEREMHRSDHAHFQAHSLFAKIVVAAIIADIVFKGHNPITPLVPAALRGSMVQWPQTLLMAIGLLYISLPQAILLWTEPDMDA